MLRNVFIFLSLFGLTAFAETNPKAESSIRNENFYDGYLQSIKTAPFLIPFLASKAEDTKIFVDALWDVVIVEQDRTVQNVVRGISDDHMALADRVRLRMLGAWPEKTVLDQALQSEVDNLARRKSLDLRTLYILFSHLDHIEFDWQRLAHLKKIYAEELEFLLDEKRAFRARTKAEIQDLYFNAPELADYENGMYQNGVRLFMFCRNDRKYPCLFLMKDRNNQPVYESTTKLWNQPALGLSALGLPYNQRNGNTPSGVMTMDSVMPSPEPIEVYGKFRRVMLNFVPKARDESHYRKFLPASAQNADWWKEAAVARDVGRDLFRIHGAGKIKSSPSAPHYPLNPTLGCIMQRENKVGRTDYKDQRRLLDTLMESLGLEKTYENEARIIGVLHVINLDNKKKAVTYEDIKAYLDL